MYVHHLLAVRNIYYIYTVPVVDYSGGKKGHVEDLEHIQQSITLGVMG